MNKTVNILLTLPLLIKFIIKYIFYNIIYTNKFSFGLKKSYIGGNIEIKNNGTLSSGNHFRSRKNTTLNITGGELKIGINFFMNQGCRINCKDKITIEDNVMMGENVLIYDHDHKITKNGAARNEYKTQPITIESGVWIGAGTIITKGVKIGKNSVIAAGSIVTKNIPENTIFIQKRESKEVHIGTQ